MKKKRGQSKCSDPASPLWRPYWVFFGSSLVAFDEVPLPLGVAVEPLG